MRSTRFRITVLVPVLAMAAAAYGQPAWELREGFTDPRTSSGVEGASASLIGDKIYVSHGFRGGGGDTALLSVYDIPSDTWTHAGPDASIGRSEMAGATALGRHYAIGGRTGPNNQVEEFDPATGTWRTMAPMPGGPRGGLGAASWNDMIYVVGGRTGAVFGSGTILNLNERFDPSTNTWETLAPMPIAVSDNYATVAACGNIYVFGGATDSLTVISDVQIYDIANDTWSFGAPMPTARAAAMVGVCGGKIYVYGGFDPVTGANLAVTEIYDPVRDSWSAGPDMVSPASEMAQGVTFNGEGMYAIGSGIFGPALSTVQFLACPANRAESSEKGSLLIYSKIDLRWDADGNLIQDTFLDLTNDYPSGVIVQIYFVNGDPPTDPVFAGDPPILVERGHPGWNSVDCQIMLTRDQPTYWSSASGLPGGCQPFTVLDPGDPPGRPDPDNPGGRMLRGFVYAWAIDNFGKEISWNHLKGDAVIVNYQDAAAWEYNAYAFQCNCGLGRPTGSQGHLMLDNQEYEYAFDKLLFDFYATGSLGLSGPEGVPGVTVQVDSDLTLYPVDQDLRQETEGPVTTKANFDIWNQNEVRFSGTHRCITCWDQTLLSRYTTVANQFLRGNLHTDKGKARINGIASDVVCGFFSRDAAILGVAAKLLVFSGATTGMDYAGLTLVGQGFESADIWYDIIRPPEPLQIPGPRELEGAGAQIDRFDSAGMVRLNNKPSGR